MDWKKEIKLSDLTRRKGSGALEEDLSADEPKTSIWKKEISLGKKHRTRPAAAEAPVAPEPVEAVVAEPTQDPEVEAVPAAASEPQPEVPAEAPAQPQPEESWPPASPAPTDLPAAIAESDDAWIPELPGEPTLLPGPAEEHDWLSAALPPESLEERPASETPASAPTDLPELASSPENQVPAPLVEPPLLYPDQGAEQRLSLVPDPTPVYELPSVAQPEDLSAMDVPVAPEGAPVPTPIAESPEEHAPRQPDPEPLVAQSLAVEPDPTLDAYPTDEPHEPHSAFPPTHTPSPAPGVHPPVPAADLPPLPVDEKPKAPLLKRELSFGRRNKEPKAPKAEKEPRSKQQRGAKVVPVATGAPAPDVMLVPSPQVPAVKGVKGSSRQRRLVGLKVGGSQLAAAQIVNNGSAELVQLAREDLPPGIVVGGELRDPDALSEALKAFFHKHRLPKRGVRLGLANNRIGVRTFEIVGVTDAKQLANAVRFRAQEALPIPIEDAVLDYQILSESQNEEGEPVRRILLVVAYRELIDQYVSACRKAGITLVGIDLEAFALLRSLAAPAGAHGTEAALVAVSVGHERSTFAVSDGQTCEFTRVLEWGGAALNVAIARELDLTPAEAEPIKRAISLLDDSVPEGLAPEHAAAAREAVRRQIQSFARELVSSLQFYQNQPGSLGIGEIVLTGGTTHLAGLAEELQRLIGVRVAIGDPLGRVRIGKRVREQAQVGSMAVAIGLGIDD